MKFQVGDKIKIPSKEHLLNHGWEAGEYQLNYSAGTSVVNIVDCGNYLTITDISEALKKYELDDNWWVNPEHLHLDDVAPEVERKLLSAEDIENALKRHFLSTDIHKDIIKVLGFTPPKVEKEVTFWVNIYEDFCVGNINKSVIIPGTNLTTIKARKQITIKYFEGEGLE